MEQTWVGESATSEAGLPIMTAVIRTRLTGNTHHALAASSVLAHFRPTETDESENTVTPTVKVMSLSMILRICLSSWRSRGSELGLEF